MPTYLYDDGEGNTVELQQSMHKKIPKHLRRNGKMYFRDIGAEHCTQSVGDPWTNHFSLAMMVHPDDVLAAQIDAKAKGLGVIEFNEDGMPHFTGDKHQKRYAEAYGFRQLNSYN